MHKVNKNQKKVTIIFGETSLINQKFARETLECFELLHAFYGLKVVLRFYYKNGGKIRVWVSSKYLHLQDLRSRE